MSKEEKNPKQVKGAEEALVTVVKAAFAPKLSPRGEGNIAYQIGRIDETVYVRITGNESGGRHSKEWVPVDQIRGAFTAAMRRSEPFKSSGMTAAFKGRSQNNSGFLVAVLRAEGVFAPHAKHKNLSTLAGDLDAWEAGQRTAKALVKNGKPEQVPLVPAPPDTRFRFQRKAAPAPSDGEGSAKQGPRKVRLVPREPEEHSEASVPKAESAPKSA